MGWKKLGFKEVEDVLIHKGKSLKQKTWLAKEEMGGGILFNKRLPTGFILHLV